MLESITHLFLQQYWWIIISLLGSFLVFLLFVQGGQTLLVTLGKTKSERTMLVNSLGRKWEVTFTTLVTFGGAFFASFPLFYSTSFGGAYWVWMAILFCFVVQAIAYEYRSKPNNVFGTKTYEIFLFVNGFLGTLLLGTAVGTFFTGSEFSVNPMNIVNLSNVTVSAWENPWHGLEAVLNIQNILLGVTVFFLARVLGILYFMNTIDSEKIFSRAKKHLLYNAIPFVVSFLAFVGLLLTSEGFAYDPASGQVYMEDYKYLHNLIEMPMVAIFFLVGVVLVLWGIIKSIISISNYGIWFSGVGTVLTVFALFLLAGFNNTAFYPSTYDLQSSLTIENSSSSVYTLKTMAFVSLFVPIVFAYVFYVWRAINNKKITEEEMESDHAY